MESHDIGGVVFLEALPFLDHGIERSCAADLFFEVTDSSFGDQVGDFKQDPFIPDRCEGGAKTESFDGDGHVEIAFNGIDVVCSGVSPRVGGYEISGLEKGSFISAQD